MRRRQDEIRFKIANITVSMQIESNQIKERVRLHYRDFISDAKPDLFIDVEYKDFPRPDFKQLLFQARSWQLGREDNHFILHFPGGGKSSLAKFNTQLNQVKFYTQDSSGQLLLYLFPEILFSLILPKYDALMLHACGVLDGEKGYLFIAPTGGGKSTLAKLADKRELTILNDDRIILTKERNLFKMYGNPWHGEVERTTNKNCTLKEIFFLEKAKRNYIFPLKPSGNMIKLIENSFYLPIEPKIKRNVFQLCLALVNKLRCLRLGFRPDESIWKFLDGFPEQNS